MRPSALEQEILAFNIAQLFEAPVKDVPNLGRVGAKGGDPMDRSRLLPEGVGSLAQEDEGAAGERQSHVTREGDLAGDSPWWGNRHAASY